MSIARRERETKVSKWLAPIRLFLGFIILSFGCGPAAPPTLIPSSDEARSLAQIYYARGLRSEGMRDQGGARFYFKRASELEPECSRAFFHRAKSNFAAGNRRFLHTKDSKRLSDAAEFYTQAIILDPKYAAAYEARAFVRIEQGSIADARKDFMLASSIDTRFFTNFSDTTWSTRNAEAAVQNFESQVEKQPDVALLRLKYGNACAAAGLVDLALEAYAHITSEEKPFHLALVARGVLYLQLGQFDAAFADLEQGVKLMPNHPGAMELLARCRFMQGRHGEALELYNLSLTNRRMSAPTLIQRGLTLVELGDWEGALRDFTNAHMMKPDAPFWIDIPGADYFESTAVQNFTEAESNSATFFLSSIRDLRAGDSVAAIEALDQCLNSAPSFALGWLLRGVIQQERDNQDAALANFNRALELNPKLARALNNRGNLFADRGREAEARADYEAAMLADSRFAWPYHNLGLLLSESDPSAAITALNRALKLDPDLTNAVLDRSKLHAATGNAPAAKCDRWLAANN